MSDDEAPANDHPNGAHVMFSTPVSSLKTPRNSVLKQKSTRFQLPTSEERLRNKHNSSVLAARYINVSFSLEFLMNFCQFLKEFNDQISSNPFYP